MARRAEFSELVRKRANDRCEYCMMHQSLQGATFHVEHVNPLTKGGETIPENLALACPSCNLHKSDRIEVFDNQSGQIVTIFNPRKDKWQDHFQWNGDRIESLTPVGSGTIQSLELNSDRRRAIRQAEMLFDLFPP